MTKRDYAEMVESGLKASRLAAPWRKIAFDIAYEMARKRNINVVDVGFEGDAFVVTFQGSGIYQHEHWAEAFRTTVLFERAGVTDVAE